MGLNFKSGKNANKSSNGVGRSLSRPGLNNKKEIMTTVAIIALASSSILWVNNIGKKAEDTVTVVMAARDIYKNEPINVNEDAGMIKPYDMLVGEYEKYSYVNDNGTKKRRVVLWDEREKLANTFAAYPMQEDRVVMYREVVKSRIDNSDSVLYSFPGKDIVKLELGSSDMEAFKTFLKPGDRLNIDGSYIDKIRETTTDEYGNKQNVEYEVFKNEKVFGGILVADLQNSQGESVLDIYAGYNEMSTWQQAKMDKDPTFKERTTPKSLLVALTPEEKARYDYFLAKSNIKFRASMPQRVTN